LIVSNYIGQLSEYTRTVTVTGQALAMSADEGSGAPHTPIFNENTLSEALTSLANRSMSRREKRDVRKQILADAASISINIDGMSLENYLNKIQLEASSQEVAIRVDRIRRNGNNKISEIIIQ
jgi:hypothetical protein